MNRLSLLFLLTASLTSLAAPPWYDERANLLFFLDEQGRKQPVRDPQDWQKRVAHIRASMELVMGSLPEKSREPLAIEVRNETALRHYTRRHITFLAEKGDRVPAYLLIPHHREGKLPAMVCLPQTIASGKDEPAGLTPSTSLAYAHDLAERGYVCIVVDYATVHTREYKTDPYTLGYASATMKGIVNHRRAIDVLESLPFVDREAIGVIGHSLGGHNALFLAVFDSRVRAIVSSCGFNVFAKHNKGDVRAWSSRAYMPRIRTVYKDDPKKIPFDFTEVLAALAPRPVFVNAPLHDAPDFEVSGVRDCVDAARPVYRQVFDAADRLEVHHPNAGHAFPLAERLAAYDFLDRHLRRSQKADNFAVGLLHAWGRRQDLEGKSNDLMGPNLRLDKGDFSISLWCLADGPPRSFDLVRQYDPRTRRGFHLSLQTCTGVTTSQPNVRQLQFGINNDHFSGPEDMGRPGNAILAFALAVHEGHLYAGTCEAGKTEAGRVFRYAGAKTWIDCGIPSRCNAVTALATFRGQLYAGTGRYRLAGSALEESSNETPGGRIYRHEGGTRWTDCGQLPDTEAVGGLVGWRGKLYASSLYKPAGLFRHDGGTKWTRLETPDGKRVEALAVFQDRLYASSYDGGHVYRYDGKGWQDLGRLGENTQTYSFSVFRSALHVGTWPSGRVYRLEKGDRWTDCGQLGEEKEVMGMMVHNGELYAGTLPLAEVYRYEGDTKWKRMGRIDHTPDVKYRRAWTMASFQGQLIVSALPSGKVFAFEAGRSVTWDYRLPANWHHIVAVKEGGILKLFVDGQFAAASTPFDPAQYDLTNPQSVWIGTATTDFIRDRLSSIRLYRRALTPEDVRALSKLPRP